MDLRDIEAFDEFVKNSLDKVEVPYDAASWSILEEKSSAMSDLPIDNLADEALATMKVPYDASSWDSLQDKLSSLDDVPVDELAFASMSGLQVPYEPSSWDSMEAKWTESEAADLDQISRRAVGDLTVPYEPASWAVLLERLENVEYKRRLIALKMLEAAVVILLLITIGRYTGPILENRINELKVPQEEQLKPEQADKSTADQQSMAIAPMLKDPVLKDNAANVNNAGREAAISDIEGSTAIEKPNEELGQLAQLEENQIGENQAPSIDGKSHSEVSTAKNLSVEKSVALIKSMAPPPVGTNNLRSEKSELVINQMVSEKRESKDLGQIAWRAHQVQYDRDDAVDSNPSGIAASSDLVLAVAAPILAPKILQTRVGLYSQVSRHDLQSNVPGRRGEVHEQILTDIGGGFMANLQFGRLGLDLGFGYEKMVYSAPNIYQLASNEIHKVHLPVHLRINAIHNHRLNVYAKAGVAAHGVVFARYHEQSTTLRGQQTISENEFNDGLFEDGLTDNNFYMMKNIGLGADGKIGKDFSMFAEALYQDNLSGSIGSLIGGDRHTMRSYSLLVGVLYHFD